MFVGHFGVALAGKKTAERPSLGTLFMASQWIDLIWPLLLLLGWEQVAIEPGNTAVTPLNFLHYPITHSLGAVLGWGLLFAGVYYWQKKDRTGALWLGLLVVSHWLLDFITHRPDLPLFPGEAIKVGLGLWNSIPGTLVAELAIFGFGIFIYLRKTRPTAKTGSWSFWALIVFLGIIYFGNIFGPPPPSVNAIGIAGLSQWLIVAWCYWIDRHREISS